MRTKILETLNHLTEAYRIGTGAESDAFQSATSQDLVPQLREANEGISRAISLYISALRKCDAQHESTPSRGATWEEFEAAMRRLYQR